MEANPASKNNVSIVQLSLSEEALRLLQPEDKSLEEMTEITNHAGWYVSKPGQ